MAKVKLRPGRTRAQGKRGNVVFRKDHDEIILAQAPDKSGVAPPEKQRTHRERFKLAVLYGKTVMADPARKAVYEARAKARGQPAFALRAADFLHGPVVEQIDLSRYTGQAGETLRITASDDFGVTGVAVAVHDTTGAMLEQGAATAADGQWTHVTTTALPTGRQVSLEVTASDRSGHKGTKTQFR
jgi:hypothetical protein